ncbi:hypothetical protein D3C77_477880 [compost metagenome]
MRLGRQRDNLAAQPQLVPRREIFQQNLPGHPIHDEVVDRDQQMVPCSRPEQTQLNQRPVLQVHSLLDERRLLLDCGACVLLHRNVEHMKAKRFASTSPAYLYDVPIFLAVNHPQRVMVFRQHPHGFPYRRFPEPVRTIQHHRLIPVMTLRDASFEEPPLDRAKRGFSFHWTLFCGFHQRLDILTGFLDRRMCHYILYRQLHPSRA